MPIPTELTRVSVNWPSEAAAPTESNSTFGQVELTAKKLAGLTDGISRELLSDSAIDIVGLLTEQFMYAIGLELDNQVLNGTGSPCSGVLTAAAGNSVVMSGANFSSIGADDLSEMIYNLAEEDAAMAKFVYNRLVQHYIRTLKDDNNQYIWQKPGEGRTGTIWELPYFQSSKAPGTSATSTAFVALGNWKKFFIGRRVGQMSLEMDPYSEFAKDLVRFKMVTRWGMAMARASAFCRLVTGS
jgi:HK97 family phage major capsid protein